MRRLNHLAAALALTLVAAGCKGDTPPAPPAPGDAASSPLAAPTSPSLEDTSPAPGPEGWRVIAPPGAGVTFEMPGEADHRASRAASSSGVEVALNQYMRYEETRNRTFVVAYSPHLVDDDPHAGHDHAPGEPVSAEHALSTAAEQAKAALDAVVEPQLSAPGRTLVSRRNMDLGGHPGQEIIVQAAEAKFTGRIHMRLFLIGEQLFQLIAAVPNEADYPDALRFLDSLALTKDAPAPPTAVAAGAAPAAHRWRRYDPGPFSVQVPSAPRATTAERDTPFGRRTVASHTATRDTPNARFIVNVIPLGEQRGTPAPDLVQQWRVARTKSVVDGGLVFAQTIAVKAAGGPGRQLVFTRPAAAGVAPLTVRYLGVPRGDNFVELVYEPLAPETSALTASRFFDSLQLPPPEAP